MKKILFPTDFSKSSENAFRYALLLADQLEASIKVVHTVMPATDMEPYGAYINYSSNAITEGARIQMKTFVRDGLTQVLEQLKHAPLVDSEVIMGTPVNTICNMAKEEEADFIVMGSRGKNKSGIEKLLGSVAAGIVENAKTAVIVLPEHAEFKATNTIAYATNLSDSDPFEIWKTIQSLNPITSKVYVLHVRLAKENAATVGKKMKEMEAFFEDRKSSVDIEFRTISGGNLQVELDKFTRDYKPDMMVMYQPPRSMWSKLFFKSETKDRAVLTEVPLLIQKGSKV